MARPGRGDDSPADALAQEGKSGRFLALKGQDIVDLDITDVLGATQEERKMRNIPPNWFPYLDVFQG